MTDKTTAELCLPIDGVTVQFVAEVKDAMSWQRPVSQNAIWNCLGWAIELHHKHEILRAQLRELAGTP